MPHRAARTPAPVTMMITVMIVAIPSAAPWDIGSDTAAPDGSIQIGTARPAASPSGAVTVPVWGTPDRSRQVALTQSGTPAAWSDPIVGAGSSKVATAGVRSNASVRA